MIFRLGWPLGQTNLSLCLKGGELLVFLRFPWRFTFKYRVIRFGRWVLWRICMFHLPPFVAGVCLRCWMNLLSQGSSFRLEWIYCWAFFVIPLCLFFFESEVDVGMPVVALGEEEDSDRWIVAGECLVVGFIFVVLVHVVHPVLGTSSTSSAVFWGGRSWEMVNCPPSSTRRTAWFHSCVVFVLYFLMSSSGKCFVLSTRLLISFSTQDTT